MISHLGVKAVTNAQKSSENEVKSFWKLFIKSFSCPQARTLFLEKIWYGKHFIRWALWPFALIYGIINFFRRLYLIVFCQQRFAVPIIVVGNLTVGGVGKTPLVIAMAKHFQARGLRVGIVSRGYGAQHKKFPYEVQVEDNACKVGDEPLLLAKKTACPVVIAPKRVDAVRYLLERNQSQIILSDDGLQHYAMGRAIEIAVIDGERKWGNGLCLPAGPLRERINRLKKCDLLVANGAQLPGAFVMHLKMGLLTNIVTGEKVAPEAICTPVAAVAAIGNPQRFFASLGNLGITYKKYPYPDHHQFCAKELEFFEKTVVMTEKDAVKCQPFAADTWYFLPVEAELNDSFWQKLWSHKQLQGLLNETTRIA